MAIADIRKEMDSSFVNFSSLMQKYVQPCVDLSAGINGRIAASHETAGPLGPGTGTERAPVQGLTPFCFWR
jgi:hypothetical protein